MALFYSDQFNAAYVAVPVTKIRPGDQSGDIKCLAFDVTLAGAITTSDILKLGKIPKGARVLSMRFNCTDLGTTGAFNIGHAASDEKDSAGSPVEAAAATFLGSAIDVNTAAVATTYFPAGSKRVAAEVDLQIVPSTATTAAGTINGYLLYVMP